MRISDWSSDVCSSDLAAWSLLILAILLSARPVIAGADAAFWLLLATVLLVLLQLVPLPPAIWTALPGRDVLLGALPGEAGWRTEERRVGTECVSTCRTRGAR